jgi:hypothetical protein
MNNGAIVKKEVAIVSIGESVKGGRDLGILCPFIAIEKTKGARSRSMLP